MLTKKYVQEELARRIAGIRPNVPTNTDVLIGELKSALMLVDCLPDDQPLPEDTVLFNKGVEEGRRLEREENLDHDVVYWKGIQYAKEHMLKDGLDAVKTLDFNKVEKTIAGVFVKYGMDRQKELMMKRAVFSLDKNIEQVHLEHVGRVDALIRDAFLKHFGFPITDVMDTENFRRVVMDGGRIEQFQYREETFFIWKPGTEYSVDEKTDCISITMTTECAQV